MEGRAPSGSRPLPRPPPPPATFAPRLRAGGVGAVALLAWAVVVPGFAPAGALAAGRPPEGAGVTPTSAPAAAGGGAGGGGAPASPAVWVVPAGGGPTIPALTLRAYREAAAWAAGFDPDCR